jgi:hypothetical protein
VIAAPEQTEAARAFLGHGSYVTTEDHYIVAQSLAASRQRAALIAKLRRTLPGAKQNADTSCDGCPSLRLDRTPDRTLEP